MKKIAENIRFPAGVDQDIVETTMRIVDSCIHGMETIANFEDDPQERYVFLAQMLAYIATNAGTKSHICAYCLLNSMAVDNPHEHEEPEEVEELYEPGGFVH